VLEKGYAPLKTDSRLDKLFRNKTYLVWYHHLHTAKAILAKQAAVDAKCGVSS
jgi:hypothetical protein